MPVDTGSVYRATFAVTGADGNPANCATMALTVTLPDQTTTPASVANPPAVTGAYLNDFPVTQAGLHKFAWLGTSPGVSKTDYVNAVAFRSVLSLAETKEALGMHDPGKDEMLRGVMAAATKAAERVCGTLVPRTYTDQWISGARRNVITIRFPYGPLLSATSVTSVASVYPGGPSWALTDMIINPELATARLKSMVPWWYGPWKSTYTAGRTVISDDVIEGVKEICWDLWAIRRWLTPDAAEPDMAEAAAYEGLPPGYEVHGRALKLLEGERRPHFA